MPHNLDSFNKGIPQFIHYLRSHVETLDPHTFFSQFKLMMGAIKFAEFFKFSFDATKSQYTVTLPIFKVLPASEADGLPTLDIAKFEMTVSAHEIPAAAQLLPKVALTKSDGAIFKMDVNEWILAHLTKLYMNPYSEMPEPLRKDNDEGFGPTAQNSFVAMHSGVSHHLKGVTASVDGKDYVVQDAMMTFNSKILEHINQLESDIEDKKVIPTYDLIQQLRDITPITSLEFDFLHDSSTGSYWLKMPASAPVPSTV